MSRLNYIKCFTFQIQFFSNFKIVAISALHLPATVLGLFYLGQLQLLLLCCPFVRRGSRSCCPENHPWGHHLQRQTISPDRDAVDHRGVPVLGGGFQLFQEVLCLWRRWWSGSKMSWHAHCKNTCKLITVRCNVKLKLSNQVQWG